MDTKIVDRLDTLPYPAILLSPKGRRLRRNRLARCLLPPLSHLGDILQFEKNEGEFLREVNLDGIPYLMLTLSPEKDCRLFCFFEHFLPFQDAFSRAILMKMQDFFWDFLNREDGALISEEAAVSDQIVARACALRMHGDDFMRLLNTCEILTDTEAKTCSLSGFFGHLQRALEMRGIRTLFQYPKDVTVLSEGAILSYLVLNLIHFVHLYAGEQCVRMIVREEECGVRFSVDFPDDGQVTASLEGLICNEKGNEHLLSLVPMLCVLRLCLEKGIPWNVSRHGTALSVSFVLKKGEEKPVLFLESAAAKEVSELLQMVKSFFS